MSDRKLTPIAKELIEAKARISDINNWCIGETRNERGQMCAFGAVGQIDFLKLTELLDKAAIELYGYVPPGNFHRPAAYVNDHIGHAAVMKVYDRAIQNELNAQHGD